MNEATEKALHAVDSIVQDAVRNNATLDQLGNSLVQVLSNSIRFDRFNIGLIDPALNLFHDEFVYGNNVAGRLQGHQRPLKGSVVEAAIKADEGFYFGHYELQPWLDRFPRFAPVYESGIRSMLAAPIRDKHQVVVATLVFASTDPEAYGPDNMFFAASVSKALGKNRQLLRR